MTTRRLAGILLAAPGLVACQDAPRGERLETLTTAPSAAPPLADADVRVDSGLPPRCTRVTAGAPADATFGEGAELGEAVPIAGGFAVGLLRTRADSKERQASVARIGLAATPPVDLGPMPRDVAPPQPMVRGDELYAVTYLKVEGLVSPTGARVDARQRRALSVQHVGAGAGGAERLVQLSTEADASGAYDVIAAPLPTSPIGALVAWDEDVGTPPHGSVQVAALSPDLHAVRATRAVRPLIETAAARGAVREAGPLGDAGDPRLALRGHGGALADQGYWLTYVVRRLEHTPSALPLPAGEIETPSEESMFGWVEAVALDAEGAPIGAPHRLTSVTGHVSGYAATSRDGALVVVAEDDGATAGRGGGKLEHVIWRQEAAPESNVIVHVGVEEETPPSIIHGVGTDEWLSFLDVKGDTELAPLVDIGAKAATPSHEPLLSGGRLLGVSAGRLALAASDRDAPGSGPVRAWTLRWMACTR